MKKSALWKWMDFAALLCFAAGVWITADRSLWLGIPAVLLGGCLAAWAEVYRRKCQD